MLWFFYFLILFPTYSLVLQKIVKGHDDFEQTDIFDLFVISHFKAILFLNATSFTVVIYSFVFNFDFIDEHYFFVIGESQNHG